jgi:putative phosphoesterase
MNDVDEVWHAGDIGSLACANQLIALKLKTRVVWGNIDNAEIRRLFDKDLIFDIEGLKVFMTHIGGYPGRYYKEARDMIKRHRPDLFVCGHSHILRVMSDKNQESPLLHMNPGACGNKGFHKFRTLLKFEVANGKIQNLRAIELGIRGTISKDHEAE